jgi:predicted Holliday junction resolvase-like endonuclease
MNGFRKNKGIIIELTSLLDIIMIMLFWVMLNISNSAQDVEKKAQEKIDAANAQATQAQQEAEEKISKAQEDAKAQIAQEQERSKETARAVINMQNALDGFSNGMMVTVEMRFEDNHDVIYVSQNGGTPVTVEVNDELSKNIVSALNSYGLDKDSIILAAFMYDGDKVLYRDVNKVGEVLSTVRGNYKNLYFTHINTTKK